MRCHGLRDHLQELETREIHIHTNQHGIDENRKEFSAVPTSKTKLIICFFQDSVRSQRTCCACEEIEARGEFR
jgi:hypothetical protein